MTTPEDIAELQQTAAAMEKLAANPEAFNAAYEAYMADDAGKFESALSRADISQYCHLVCRFFCRKVCGGKCRKFCPQPNDEVVDAAEILAFTNAIVSLFKDEAVISAFADAMEADAADKWNELLAQYKLQRFCAQLCSLLCSWRCKRKCTSLCPAKPLITRIGSIPISQINAAGFANGPSIPPFFVAPPNPAAGYGDHPFGGAVWLMGVFNMPTAVEYLVEVSSTGPLGSYSPILVGPQTGYDNVPPQPPAPPVAEPTVGPPWNTARSRSQSTGADPGWFKINELTDSDGGRFATGEKTLMMWPSPLPDGLYYLRLRVRDAALVTRVSSPQPLLLDNTGPFPLPKPTISLQLQQSNGTRTPLKCGKVRKGDGLIVVTIQAYDPNMSTVTVTARGNSGLSVPVVDTSAVPLSKTYNGNVADQGYPVPTEFLWDPWSDPNIVPCCYLVYVEITDRTIINNAFYGGHYAQGWEAIEIGF